MMRWIVIGLCAIGFGGCDDGAGLLDGGARLDGSAVDGALADGALSDGALPDGAFPDMQPPDAALPDGALPDGALPDMQQPDAGAADRGIPDLGGDAGGPVCGDGVLESPEACDDGNRAAGDGCSATCTVEACAPGDCADDDPCTADRCDPAQGCVNAPIPDCAPPGFACSAEGAAAIDGLQVVEAFSSEWLCATEWSGQWHRDPATNTCGALCGRLEMGCVGARGGDFGWGQPAGTAILGCDVPQPEVAAINGQPDIFCLCDRGPAPEYVADCSAAAAAAPMPAPAVCAEEAGGTAQNATLCLFEQPAGAGTCDDICGATGTRCVTARESDFGFCGDGVGPISDHPCDAPTAFGSLCVCYRGQGEPLDPLVCAADRADCDQQRDTGCEVDLTADAAHCGACDRACGAEQRCVDSACVENVVLPPGACMEAGVYDDPVAFGLPILNDFQAPGLVVPANPFVLDGIRYPDNFQLSSGACIPNLDSNAPGCGGDNVYLVSFGGANDIDPVEPVNRLGFRWGDQGDPTTFVVHFVDGSAVQQVVPGRRGFFGYCSPGLAIDRITMSGGDYGIDDIRCDACR